MSLRNNLQRLLQLVQLMDLRQKRALRDVWTARQHLAAIDAAMEAETAKRADCAREVQRLTQWFQNAETVLVETSLALGQLWSERLRDADRAVVTASAAREAAVARLAAAVRAQARAAARAAALVERLSTLRGRERDRREQDEQDDRRHLEFVA